MKLFLSALLMACGILIAGLSGLCSIIVLTSSFQSIDSEGLGIVAMVGGIPFATGLMMTWLGRRLVKSARAEEVAKAAARDTP